MRLMLKYVKEPEPQPPQPLQQQLPQQIAPQQDAQRNGAAAATERHRSAAPPQIAAAGAQCPPAPPKINSPRAGNDGFDDAANAAPSAPPAKPAPPQPPRRALPKPAPSSAPAPAAPTVAKPVTPSAPAPQSRGSRAGASACTGAARHDRAGRQTRRRDCAFTAGRAAAAPAPPVATIAPAAKPAAAPVIAPKRGRTGCGAKPRQRHSMFRCTAATLRCLRLRTHSSDIPR